MDEKQDKRKVVFILVLIVLLTIFGFGYLITHNKSYKNEATVRGDEIYLNGVRYWQTSELDKYTISNVMICKTDTGMKLYEIEEYPDYKYIAGYYAWDGEIYKRDESDR